MIFYMSFTWGIFETFCVLSYLFGCHSGRATCHVFNCSRCKWFSPTRIEIRRSGTLPLGLLRRLQLSEDLDLSKELILDAGGHVSLQGSPLMFTSCLHLLIFQLFLEAGKHLEKLTFSGVLCFKLIYPHLGYDDKGENSSSTSLTWTFERIGSWWLQYL